MTAPADEETVMRRLVHLALLGLLLGFAATS
jgi:hypothetical protein